MRLRELRVFRAIFRQPADMSKVEVVEWTPGHRHVRDWEYFSSDEESPEYKVVAGTIGPDPKGKKVKEFLQFLDRETFDVAVLEGPGEVKWSDVERWAEAIGWTCILQGFLTSELGEAMVRRRVAGFVCPMSKTAEAVEFLMVKAVTPPAMGSYLQKVQEGNCMGVHKFETAINVGQEVMLPVVAAHAWVRGERQHVYSMSGPCRWPLLDQAEKKMQRVFVLDKAAPVGTVRALSGKEIWMLQGRRLDEWEMVSQIGELETEKEGCKATGRRTALSLIGVAAELAKEGHEGKAGMCVDYEDYKSLGALLRWLRKWRRGDFRRAEPQRKAGGLEDQTSAVWFWGEELWLEALGLEERGSGNFEGAELRR